jgi:subtilisin-like proprotein convertase family protein
MKTNYTIAQTLKIRLSNFLFNFRGIQYLKKHVIFFSLILCLFIFDSNAQSTFSNTSDISIPDGSSTSSTINVSGIGTSILSVSVRLPNISHTWYDDLDIMLISPSGQRIILMSDCGGNNSGNGNRNYVFIQGGTTLSDGAEPTASGNVSPGDYELTDTWPDGSPTISAMNQFTGNPNGNWTLRIIDDTGFDTGSLIGGWSITISHCTPQTPGIITPSAPGYTALEASWADPGQQNIMYVCPGTTVTFTRSGGSGTGNRYYWMADGTNGLVLWNLKFEEVQNSAFNYTFNSPGVYYLYHYPSSCSAGFDYNQYARSIIFVESVFSGGYSADQTICYNSLPVQMQGGNVSSYYYTNFNYLWQQSTDNGVSWSNAGGTNNQANYTPTSNLTQTTLYKRVTNLTQCSGNTQSQSEGKDVTWAWTTGVASTYPTADANDVFTWGQSINKNSWSGVDGWGANAAAAISNESITNNGGYVEAIMQWNYYYAMMGLSDNNQVAEWTSIKYAIYPRADAQLEVYESGVSRGIVGTYVANDRLRVSVENNQVKYYKNSTLLYTSTVAPTFPLFLDVSIYSVNGGFKDLRIVNPIKVTVTPQLTPPTVTNISNP